MEVKLMYCAELMLFHPHRAKVRSIKTEFCIIFAQVRTTNQLAQIPHLKSLSKQILRISAVNLIWNLKICQEPRNHGQGDVSRG